MEQECTLSIVAAEETLLVTLRFPSSADREALQNVMFQVISAFATVERLSEKEVEGLLWERKRLSPVEQCVVLRRPFTDPDYPQKFDVAFRRIHGDLNALRIH